MLGQAVPSWLAGGQNLGNRGLLCVTTMTADARCKLTPRPVLAREGPSFHSQATVPNENSRLFILLGKMMWGGSGARTSLSLEQRQKYCAARGAMFIVGTSLGAAIAAVGANA